MIKLIELLQELPEEISDMNFPEVLRNSRDKLGLMQYKVAEHLGIQTGRLKNLETGYFRSIPAAKEIEDISEFYGLPLDEMKEKAERYVYEKQHGIRKLYA